MARTVLRDVTVTIGGVDYSNHVKSVAVTSNTDVIDITKFGDLAHVYAPGLQADEIEVEFYQDFAVASIHQVLQPLLGSTSGATIVVKPTSAPFNALTNPVFTMVAAPFTYQPLDGTVGAASMTKVLFKPVSGVAFVAGPIVIPLPIAVEADSTDCDPPLVIALPMAVEADSTDCP
jgi:hypothetical protein